MTNLPVGGPVVADTVYSEGKLVARDVSITLPEVNAKTTDVSAMGTLTMPIWQLIDHMEATVTKVGLDNGFRRLITPQMKPLEFRFPQQVTDQAGNSKTVSCKAFIRGIPTKIPGVGVNVAEAMEGEIPIAVTRYALYVDGEEYVMIDRLAGVIRIDGTDYMGPVNSML